MHNNKGVVKKTFTAPFPFAFAPEKAKLLFEAQRRAREQLPLARRIFWEDNDLCRIYGSGIKPHLRRMVFSWYGNGVLHAVRLRNGGSGLYARKKCR